MRFACSRRSDFRKKVNKSHHSSINERYLQVLQPRSERNYMKWMSMAVQPLVQISPLEGMLVGVMERVLKDGWTVGGIIE